MNTHLCLVRFLHFGNGGFHHSSPGLIISINNILHTHFPDRILITSLYFLQYLQECWEKAVHPTQYSCLENPMDGGACWTAVRGVAKSLTRLRDLPFTFRFHALEKKMATHFTVLAWRIPGMGVPDGMPSMGLHRVGHD